MPYKRVVIPGVNDKVSNEEFRERVAPIQQEARLYHQRSVRARLPRRKRTFLYTKQDFDFFDRVEELNKLSKAQLIEHILRLEHSLEELQ